MQAAKKASGQPGRRAGGQAGTKQFFLFFLLPALRDNAHPVCSVPAFCSCFRFLFFFLVLVLTRARSETHTNCSHRAQHIKSRYASHSPSHAVVIYSALLRATLSWIFLDFFLPGALRYCPAAFFLSCKFGYAFALGRAQRGLFSVRGIPNIVADEYRCMSFEQDCSEIVLSVTKDESLCQSERERQTANDKQ